MTLELFLLFGIATSGYSQHNKSYCSAVHCHGARCTGISWAGNIQMSQCQEKCKTTKCACYQWRDPQETHPSPIEPACITTNISSDVTASTYGYTAWANSARPDPTPTRRIDYTNQGAIEVDTNENTLFMWKNELYVLENIPCYYSEHASNWDSRFINASYARIRRMDNGDIVLNITSSIGFGFISAFVDDEHDTVWLFGSSCNRCSKYGGHGCRGAKEGGFVQVWSNRPNKSSLLYWDTKACEGTFPTYNVEVTSVHNGAVAQKKAGLPPHKYVMILEISPRFLISNSPNGDLTSGWFEIPDAVDPPLNGGPSISWNPQDGLYYAILGGHHVELIRTSDFRSWERSKNAPFIEPSSQDGLISPFAGFPKIAKSRGFLPMENTTLWDWNSNDVNYRYGKMGPG
eukprot:UC4_evm1s1216